MTGQRRLAELVDMEPSTAEFQNAVLTGLSQPQKSIPCKFFYDAEGSALFEAICETPEYYPTRTERALLSKIVPEIAAHTGAGRAIVEFGSGAGTKIRTLIAAMNSPAAYVPVDISRARLVEVAATLAAEYPWLHVAPVCADYTKPFGLPRLPARNVPWLGFFPGSTIGNFTPPQATGFLAQARRLLDHDGLMLVGVDLKKAKPVLEAAYNDADGVTAAFNLNLLHRINRELDGTFDPSRFAHRAIYDADHGRIEMHLVSRAEQSASVGGQTFAFALGETIHTENSYKYDLGQFRHLAESAGWATIRTWTDPEDLFGLILLSGQHADGA